MPSGSKRKPAAAIAAACGVAIMIFERKLERALRS
jgi:hypothetical protein